jgi:hypothetical protein
VEFFQSQLTTDNEDLLYHHGISNTWHFPFLSRILNRNTPRISGVYGSVQSGAQNSILYSLVFINFQVFLLFLKLLAHFHSSVIPCSSLSRCLSIMTRYIHVLRHPVPLGSTETSNWIRDNEVACVLFNVLSKGCSLWHIHDFFPIWHYLLHCDLCFTDTIIDF